MKKNILFIFYFICLSAHAQNWQWKNATPESKILKDSGDNLYVFSNNNPNFTIEKLDQNGTVLWTKIAIGAAEITAYKTDNSNQLVLIGNLTSSTTIDAFTLIPKGQQSFFILILSPNSTVLSANVYGSPNKTFANDIFINANGEYLIGGGFTGTFDMNGNSITGDTLQNLFIVKTDRNQNVLWSEKGTPIQGGGLLNEIVETSSGKIYVTITFVGFFEYKGYQFNSSGQYLMQLDNSRNITWVDYLGYPGLTFNYTSDIQTNGDTVYMKEYFEHHGASASIYRWTDSGIKTGAGFSNAYTIGYSVSNGKIYYALLTANHDNQNPNPINPFYYRKIGSLTLQLSEQGQTADSTVTLYGSYSEVQYINANSLYIGGYGEGMNTFFAGKFNTSMAVSVADKNNENNQLQIFPNPSSGIITVNMKNKTVETKICVYDILGNCVNTTVMNNETGIIDLSKESKGIYFVELLDGNERVVKKVAVQ